MRRALALLTATAGWVAVIQLVIGTSPSPPEFEVEGLSNPVVMGLVDSQTTHKTLAGVERSVVTTTSSTTSTTTTTTTTAAPTTTTAAPKPTTTTAPRQTTTTTAPKPATTTTAAPTTTAPPETTTTTEAPSGNFSSGAESDFISRINQLRASEGLKTLEVSSSLRSYARNWAAEMAEDGEISHSNLQAYINTTSWKTLGENVGTGGSVGALFEAFKKSSAHYQNIVNPDFTHIGVGVYVDADGVLWTSHVFGG